MKVKQTVWARDKGRCIVCWSPNAFPNAHVFVRRSHGGLGVVENVVTLCLECHRKFDQGKNKENEIVSETIFRYMNNLYKNINIGRKLK